MTEQEPPVATPAAAGEGAPATAGEGAPAAAGEEPPKKPRGKPKDPDAPPKPKNAYQLVTGAARPRLKEENPQLASDLKAMGEALKAEWDKVPQEEKDRLQAVYEKEMEIWKPKWAAYKETPGYKDFFEIKQDYVDGKMKKKLIKKHGKDAPKRPRSGYMIFAGEIRERVSKEVTAAGGGLSDVGKKISDEWQAVSEAKKAEYGEVSARQKEVFDVEYAKYKKTDAFKEFTDEKAKLESRQTQKKLIRVKFREAPKKPPSAFALFRKEIMPTLETKGKTTGDIAKMVSAKFAEVPEDKKAELQKQADVFKAEYEKKTIEFRKANQYSDYLKERYKVKLRENKLVNLRDQPKKPKSVFAIYAEKHKDEVKKLADQATQQSQEGEEGQEGGTGKGKGKGKGSRILKEKFAQATEDEKKELEALQQEAKEKYNEEVRAWKESDRYKAFEKTNLVCEKEMQTAALKVMTLKFLNAGPAQPPKTAFSIFVGEKRKAAGAAEGEKKSKEAKKAEVEVMAKEWNALDKPSKAAYDATYKDQLKAWEEEVKTFMAQDIWKAYIAEAKQFKVPIKNLLAQKSKALAQLGGAAGMPQRPENMPSKPPDAYKVFLKEKESELGGAAKVLEAWEKMDTNAKSKYFSEAGKLQEEYEKEMNDFKQTDEGKNYFRDVSKTLRLKKLKTAKSLYLKDMPTAPPSALKVYVEKTMAELKKSSPDLKGHEARKQAEDKWKAMDPEERKVLDDEASVKYQEFQDKMKEFKATPNFTKFTRANMASAPPPKPSGAPRKPMDAFRQYCKDMKGLGKSNDDLKKAFDELPEEERAERKRKSEELAKKYTEDVAVFQKTPEWKKYRSSLKVHSKRTSITLAKSKFCVGEPKRPAGAWQLFVTDRRSSVMKENPDIKGLGPVMTKLKEVWTALTQEEKLPWIEKEKAAAEEYKKAMEEYQQSDNYKAYMKVVKRFSRPQGKGKAKAKAKSAKGKARSSAPAGLKEPENMPKRPPLNPMALFMRDNKDKSYNLKTGHLAWVALEAEGQKTYIEQLKDLNKAYEADFKAFQKTPEGKKYLRLKKSSEKKAKEHKAKEKFLGGENAPKEPKRPPTAYFLFLGEKREGVVKELGSAKFSEVSNKLTSMWGALEADEKKSYEEKAKALKEEYDKEMEAFRSSDGYKAFSRALQNLNKKPSRKPAKAKSQPKAKAKAAAGKAAGRGSGAASGGRGRGRGAAAGAAAADSGSDAMGSDSSSDSSSSDDDSD